jgi:rhamnogalacturonyl hydrolase YesR
MIKYARFEQVRLPESKIYTRLTPEKYTTWVDDMYMGIPFLMQAALYSKDETVRKQLFDDAANQILLFNDQVWDKDAKLYMHAHYSDKNVKLPHWSRANGWGIWATTEVLLHLPKKHPLYKSILSHYKTHVQSLVKLQDQDSGFWHNVLDRPDSPEEMSGTAIFTMAIARGINQGWLNRKEFEPIVLKAWEAMKTQIEPDGTVHKICMGTMCSEDVNYYLNRPFFDNDTHGLLAVLFAGIEVSKMVELEKK